MKKILLMGLLGLMLTGCNKVEEVQQINEEVKVEQVTQTKDIEAKRKELNEIIKAIEWDKTDEFKWVATFTNTTSFDIGMYDVYYQSTYQDGSIYKDTFTIVNLPTGESKLIEMWKADANVTDIEILGSEYTE